METESNAVTTELFEFMTHCASVQLSEETRRKATQYLRVVTELEEVCDCCNRLTPTQPKLSPAISIVAINKNCRITIKVIRLYAEYISKPDEYCHYIDES